MQHIEMKPSYLYKTKPHKMHVYDLGYKIKKQNNIISFWLGDAFVFTCAAGGVSRWPRARWICRGRRRRARGRRRAGAGRRGARGCRGARCTR